MANLIGLPGSLRSGSFNAALLRAAATLLPEGSKLEVGTIRGIPLYDADVEAAAGIPSAVALLKEAIAAADGLLLATPEYNHSIPGVFKNALDWLTRPPADVARVFGGKPVAVIGASPGAFGTLLGQEAWLPVLRALGVRPWFGGQLLVARATAAFDANGALIDAEARERLRRFLAGFVAFASTPKPR